jgi:5'-methylthioadenosine phosphorylase
MNNASKNKQPVIGIIGGSGLYDMQGFSNRRLVKIKTPFGPPSAPIILGSLSGVSCAFLARHGQGHTILPSEINVRANIWALKSLGVNRIVAVTAVGSLKEEMAPRHFVFPDQIFERAHGRTSTFFGDGIVAHTAFDAPICIEQSKIICEKSSELGISSHWGGTYVCMQGPLFSSWAESHFHRSLGHSIIGMTASTEAKLAREAELCYSLVSLVTDYDCWKVGEEVSADKVTHVMHDNSANAQKLLASAIGKIANRKASCRCPEALKGAIVTDPKAIKPAVKKKLSLIIGKYISK